MSEKRKEEDNKDIYFNKKQEFFNNNNNDNVNQYNEIESEKEKLLFTENIKEDINLDTIDFNINPFKNEISEIPQNKLITEEKNYNDKQIFKFNENQIEGQYHTFFNQPKPNLISKENIEEKKKGMNNDNNISFKTIMNLNNDNLNINNDINSSLIHNINDYNNINNNNNIKTNLNQFLQIPNNNVSQVHNPLVQSNYINNNIPINNLNNNNNQINFNNNNINNQTNNFNNNTNFYNNQLYTNQNISNMGQLSWICSFCNNLNNGGKK